MASILRHGTLGCMGGFRSSISGRSAAGFNGNGDCVAEELRWFLLREYESDLGVRSSFGQQVETIQLGSFRGAFSPEQLGMADSVLAAASRLRRLEARWQALSNWQRAVLHCAYGTTGRILPEYGPLGPLVLHLARRAVLESPEWTGRSIETWLTGLKRREHSKFERIMSNARSILEEARVEWMATQRIVRWR